MRGKDIVKEIFFWLFNGFVWFILLASQIIYLKKSISSGSQWPLIVYWVAVVVIAILTFHAAKHIKDNF